ncbi:MAG TPA: thioredoxin domain-containing protein [Nocardioides sp.]|nr:thioredoxin domain-containing protein [Nocardioides sp.]
MSKKSKAEERAAKAAAALAERKRKERRRNLLTIGAVVLAMVVIVAVGFLINQSRDEKADEGVAAASSTYEVSIGDEDAPNEVVIYEDFLCPICQGLEAATRDQLAQLADEGQVRVSYRPFNLFSQEGDPRKEYSVAAAAVFAVVLDTSGPEVAKELHDLLYENQPSEAGPFPSEDDLVGLAVEAGADEADVREGLENGDGEDWVEKATAAANDLGINSTPTIYLNGEEFRDGRTMEELAANLVAAVS